MKNNLITKKNKKILFGSLVVITATILFVVSFQNYRIPKLKVSKINKEVIANSKEEIVIPITLSDLPNSDYPAANININFDKNKLELIEIAQGTMEVYNDYDKKQQNKPTFKVPKWSYNIDFANQEGEIKTMYLDSTAGKNAYNKAGFKKESKDIVFKLVFKLKNSANSGDIIDIKIEEAMFATVNGEVDKSTIATKKGYGDLKVENLKLKVK